MAPVALAGGGAVAADPSSETGAFLNPSLGALYSRNSVSLYGGVGSQTEVTFSVVDSQKAITSVGLSIRYLDKSPPFSDADLPGWYVNELPDNQKQYIEGDFVVAYPTADRRFSFGVGGFFSRYETARRGVGFNANVNVGVSGHLTKWLTLGLTGRNLVPETGPRDMPMGFVAAARVHKPGVASFEIDGGMLTRDGALEGVLRAGGQVSADIVRFHAGFAMHEGYKLTTGIGVGNEAGSFTYGVLIPLDGSPTLHQIGFVLLAAPAGESPF